MFILIRRDPSSNPSSLFAVAERGTVTQGPARNLRPAPAPTVTATATTSGGEGRKKIRRRERARLDRAMEIHKKQQAMIEIKR